MNTRTKFDQDFEVANAAIIDVMDCLTEKMPNEMVALVFLRYLRNIFGNIYEFGQWELLKGDLVDMRDEFMIEVEPHLSNWIRTGNAGVHLWARGLDRIEEKP